MVDIRACSHVASTRLYIGTLIVRPQQLAEAQLGDAYRRLRCAAGLPQLKYALAFEPSQARCCCVVAAGWRL